MFMEQSHNKQVASVDIFPTQCSSSIGVIRVSFTVRNDSLMRVMLFIQHTVTGGPGVNKIFHLKVLYTAFSVYTLFQDMIDKTNLILITDQHPHKKGKYDRWRQRWQLQLRWQWLLGWQWRWWLPAVLLTGAIVAWMAFCLRGQTIRSIIPDYISLCHDTSRTTRITVTIFDSIIISLMRKFWSLQRSSM